MTAEYRRLAADEDPRPGSAETPPRTFGAAAAAAIVAGFLAAALLAAVLATTVARDAPPSLRRSPDTATGEHHLIALVVGIRRLFGRAGPLGLCLCALSPLAAAARMRRDLLWDGAVTIWQSPRTPKPATGWRLAVRLWLLLMLAGVAAEILWPVQTPQAGRTLQLDIFAPAGNSTGGNPLFSNSSRFEGYGKLLQAEVQLHPRATLGFICTILGLFVLLRYVIPKCLELIAQCLIQSFDRIMLGTDVYMDKISFSVFHRSFTIDKLRVANWPGFVENSYMLTVDKVEIGASIFAMACSRGKKVQLRWLRLDGLEIFVESKQDSSLTNIVHMMEFIEGVKRDSTGNQVETASSKRTYVIQELSIRQIQVNLPKSSVVGSLQLRCADLDYKDFKEVAASHQITILPHIVKFVMTVVLRESVSRGGRTGEHIKKMGKVVHTRAMVGANKAQEDIKRVMRGKLDQAGAVVGHAKKDFFGMLEQTGAMRLVGKTGAEGGEALFSEATSSSHGVAMDEVEREAQARLKSLSLALRMSGLEPRFLAPSSGLQERHFRQLAEMTGCFAEGGQDDETLVAAFDALCLQLGGKAAQKRRHIPQADVIKWLDVV